MTERLTRKMFHVKHNSSPYQISRKQTGAEPLAVRIWLMFTVSKVEEPQIKEDM